MEKEFRIGLGQDSHRIKVKSQKSKVKTNNPLILGGVLVDENIEIIANSDGDVLLHALFNALSSAIGLHSIGIYADKMCLEQGIKDSKEYIKFIMEKVKRAGFLVNNVSFAVEAKKPRVSLEQVEEMKKIISQLLRVPLENIGIAFTSGEGLTPFGQGKGIQVFAFVSLIKK